jgi:hypothetical protein
MGELYYMNERDKEQYAILPPPPPLLESLPPPAQTPMYVKTELHKTSSSQCIIYAAYLRTL